MATSIFMEEIKMAYKHNGRWRGEVRANGQRKTKLFDKKKDAQECIVDPLVKTKSSRI